MTTPGSTPTTRRVKLKRAIGLTTGDAILPGKGLFRRDGSRMASQKLMTDAWGTDPWYVCASAWLNDVPETNVLIGTQPGDSSDVLHTPMDAYVVLARD